MTFSLKDFFAGWGAGVCGLLVGHPADTIKVKQQILSRASVFKVLNSTVKKEGVLGLYRGMLFPLLLAGVQNSIFFGVYGNFLRVLQNCQGAEINRRSCWVGTPPNKHWHLNVYFAGFTAGFIHAFLACPVDLIKVKLQASREHSTHRLKNCIKNVYHHCGILGFYRGFIITLIRDLPASGIYLLLYEHLLTIGRSPNDRSSEFSTVSQLVSGGLAGCISWILVTPLDVVKTRIQADNPENPKYRGVVHCFIASYKEGGLQVFGRGFSVHVLRGFPVNAATFVGYEWFLKMCGFLDK